MPHSTRNRLVTFALLVSLAALSATAIADDAAPPAAATVIVDGGAPPGPDAQPLPHEALPSIDQPGAVLQAVTEAKSHGGYIAMGAIALYVLAAWTMKMAGHVGWLAQGRRLAIITGAVGILGALVDHFGGAADSQTVLAAAATALGKFLLPIHPTA